MLIWLSAEKVVGALKDNCENILVDDHSKAELLNSFFCSVGLSDKTVSDNKDEITDLRFTPELVFKQLKKLKVNTAAGPDRLPTLFL